MIGDAKKFNFFIYKVTSILIKLRKVHNLYGTTDSFSTHIDLNIALQNATLK